MCKMVDCDMYCETKETSMLKSSKMWLKRDNGEFTHKINNLGR